MEFHKDRTGVLGPLMEVGGKVGIEPHTSMLMKDWRIQNDTLSIQLEMRSGYAVYGPDGKKIGKSDKPGFARYIVWEISDTEIVLEDLMSEFPGTKERLSKSERMEILDN